MQMQPNVPFEQNGATSSLLGRTSADHFPRTVMDTQQIHPYRPTWFPCDEGLKFSRQQTIVKDQSRERNSDGHHKQMTFISPEAHQLRRFSKNINSLY